MKKYIFYIIIFAIFIVTITYWNLPATKLSRLERLYYNDGANIKGKAIRAIGSITWKGSLKNRALEILLKAADDDDKWVKAEAANGLQEYDDVRVLQLADKLLSSNNLSEKMAGTSIINKNGDIRYMDKIIALLKHEKNQDIKANCASVLGKIGNQRIIPLLIGTLDDKDTVSHNAMVSLKNITGQNIDFDRDKWLKWWDKEGRHFDAIEYEVRKLEEGPNPIDKIAAANRLWRLRAKKAIPILNKALKNEKISYVKKHIETALQKIIE